jgi:hypothetical protein
LAIAFPKIFAGISRIALTVSANRAMNGHVQGDQQMARTQKQPWKEWHGFAIELKPDTDLRIGLLIAEYDSGAYEPIAAVSTINEAKEIAQSNMAARMRSIDRGEEIYEPPVRYRLWATGMEGRYIPVPVEIG